VIQVQKMQILDSAQNTCIIKKQPKTEGRL